MKNFIINQSKRNNRLFWCIVFLFSSSYIFGQSVTGKIIAVNGEPLSGVSITLKGTTKGTTSDKDGQYSIEATPKSTLLFSFIGYVPQDIIVGEKSVINVSLEEDTKDLEEVIVTGLFDERKRLGASVSITTMNVKQMERLAPNSGADLLRNVPGIFVNSSAGEIRSQVYTHVLANRPSYNDDVSGLYYISMQEDGLPISNIFLPTYTHDLFYRTDATLNRLEAVRGGTASIAGANAPGVF